MSCLLQWKWTAVNRGGYLLQFMSHSDLLKSYDSFVWWIGCNLNLCLKYFSNIICSNTFRYASLCRFNVIRVWNNMRASNWVLDELFLDDSWMSVVVKTLMSIRWRKSFQLALLFHIVKPVCTRSVFNLHPFTGLLMPAGDCIDLVRSAERDTAGIGLPSLVLLPVSTQTTDLSTPAPSGFAPAVVPSD